jgi:hypothetical protein
MKILLMMKGRIAEWEDYKTVLKRGDPQKLTKLKEKNWKIRFKI